ncbi:MAG: aminotransferase class I/II-fold pyridoxal phosphate-dependent enzyme, partial [bacterium]|nr:aminotransferase class I/II-fold pyridoxal phosphate-dependent enzyme [bacterium]
MHIPLTKPYWGKTEERFVIRALKETSGSGDGPWSRRLGTKLRALTRADFVFPVTSCTHGLELAMAVLKLSPGDEVIVPSFTMSSTANCVVLRGGTPVFADITKERYGLDPKDVERRINKKTRGIIVVHYAGMPSYITEFVALAKRHNLFLVEDAAHALGATYRGRALGTFGDIGVYSFHGTKNISCGEGGALVTNSPTLASAVEIFRT